MQNKSIHRWVIFSAMSLVFFIVTGGAFSSLGVVLPNMVNELNWNWTDAGLGYTLLGVSCGIASLFPAYTIRTFGVRGTMAIGGILLIAGFLLIATTISVWPYWLGEAFIGIAFALLSIVPGTHVLTNLFQKPPVILGAYFTIGAMGGVAGPQIYRLVDTMTGDWRNYWYVFAIAGFVTCAFAFLTLPKDGFKKEEIEAPNLSEKIIPNDNDWTVLQALRTTQFHVIVAGYTTYLLTNMTTHGFAVQHLTERGISANDAGIMLSIEALVAAIASIIGGFLAKKLSAKTLMALSLLAATIGTFGLAEARGWFMMWLYIIGVGVGFGLSLLSATMLLLEYFGKRANLEIFSVMCLLSTIAALGSFIGGWLKDVTGSFHIIMILQTLICLAVLITSLFLKPPINKAQS